MKKSIEITDKDRVIASSFITTMIFVFACYRVCYTAFDIIIFLCGALGIMIVPMACYIYSVRMGDVHGDT